MTDAEWLTCADPRKMLGMLRGKASDRKLRLFAVACCRRIWHLLVDERSRQAVEVAERFADDCASRDDVMRHALAAGDSAFVTSMPRCAYASLAAAYACAVDTQSMLHHIMSYDSYAFTFVEEEDSIASVAASYVLATKDGAERQNETAAQHDLIRDIFGSIPFRPITVNPSWLTLIVRSVADSIYTEKAFDRMPILADALEDAACDQQDILIHCRQPNFHVPGCWCLDLLLEKE